MKKKRVIYPIMDIVSLGHLIALGIPEDYGIRGFNKGSLTIFQNPFILTSKKLKKAKGYEPDLSALKQLITITQVINQCSIIVL